MCLQLSHWWGLQSPCSLLDLVPNCKTPCLVKFLLFCDKGIRNKQNADQIRSNIFKLLLEALLCHVDTDKKKWHWRQCRKMITERKSGTWNDRVKEWNIYVLADCDKEKWENFSVWKNLEVVTTNRAQYYFWTQHRRISVDKYFNKTNIKI